MLRDFLYEDKDTIFLVINMHVLSKKQLLISIQYHHVPFGRIEQALIKRMCPFTSEADTFIQNKQYNLHKMKTHQYFPIQPNQKVYCLKVK